MLYLRVLMLVLAVETVIGHGYVYPTRDVIRSNYEIEEPTGKVFHKIKKIRKKQLLLCLLGAGRGAEDSPEGKFLFPVVQQTEVNVGNPSGANHLASPYGGGSMCDSLLSGGGGFHPLLSGLGAGANRPTTDEDQNRYYHFNMNRHVIRPLYKSMKAFYRLFR